MTSPASRRRSTSARRAAFRRGHLAEWMAMLFLMAKGFRPLARRYAAGGGEIDLIMRRGTLVIFVEVKARAGFDQASVAIGPRKQRLFARARARLAVAQCLVRAGEPACGCRLRHALAPARACPAGLRPG